MSTEYLHGVETIESEVGGQTVSIVKSSVVALVGIAPTGPANQLTLCNSAQDDTKFGAAVPGFNIPKTLQIIRSIVGGGSPVLVVNTFDQTANTTQITGESQTVQKDGTLQLANAPIGDVTVFEADGVTPAGISAGQDYNIDSFGKFTAITQNVAVGTTYKFNYAKLNDSSVTPTQLIGGVDAGGNRTGIALFDLAFNMYGFNPKIFISPNYASLAPVAAAFAAAAQKFRAVYLLDAGYGVTIQQAIEGRGIYGDLVFNTQDERACLLYPYLKTWDDYSKADIEFPYSAFFAGAITATDNNYGYWYSPSNKPVSPTATGFERVIEWRLNDTNCEANQLNGNGIITAVAGFGTGFLTWGNRNAAYPANTSVKNFISLRRTDDMVIESMEIAALPYIDQPITQALIDTIREAGNVLIRTLISRGAVLPGSKVTYNPADNPAEQLANGQIVFERTYMIPTPAERITYNDVLDISLLNQFQ